MTGFHSSLIFFVAAAWLYVPVGEVYAQRAEPGIIEGRVIDAQTNKPLSGAHIFLSGTTMGTISNDAGRYSLRQVPPGAHRLTISILGFDRARHEMVIREGHTSVINVRMNPIVYEMNPIFVGNLDDRWERYLDRFEKLFLGESTMADSVRILNPEVLRFEATWWGRFSAEAMAPIEVENRALGYHITYYLNEFRQNGDVTRWDGEPLFKEMTPSEPEEADRWERNREEAFYGSVRHFLLALINNRAREEGFTLYYLAVGMHGLSDQNRTRIEPSRLVTPDDNYPVYRINFQGRLNVVYNRGREDDRYVQWAKGNLRRGPATSQTSYLQLNVRPVTIDRDGEIMEKYGVTRFDYFSFRRLAERTPREYRPAGYPAIILQSGESIDSINLE